MTAWIRKLEIASLAPGLAALALTTAGASAALLALSPAAMAQSSAAKAAVDAAKAAGQVGEQADGFLGMVNGGGGAVRAAVDEINAGRRQVYADTAARTGATPQAAGEATARQLFDRLPSGQYYRTADGNWRRK